MSDNLYRVYRQGADPATSMDWAVLATEVGVEIRQGQTDGPARYTEIPLAHCVDGRPDKEAERLVEQKLGHGYEPVGWGEYERGRLIVRRNEPQDGDELTWEVSVPINGRELNALFAEIVTDLHPHMTGRIASVVGDDGKTVQGVTMATPGGAWSFGLQEGGGLDGEGRGTGVVAREQGVAPLLVLLRVDREVPGVLGIKDREGEPVELELSASDPWLGRSAGPTDETYALATALGLCLGGQVVLNGMENDRPIVF